MISDTSVCLFTPECFEFLDAPSYFLGIYTDLRNSWVKLEGEGHVPYIAHLTAIFDLSCHNYVNKPEIVVLKTSNFKLMHLYLLWVCTLEF